MKDWALNGGDDGAHDKGVVVLHSWNGSFRSDRRSIWDCFVEARDGSMTLRHRASPMTIRG